MSPNKKLVQSMLAGMLGAMLFSGPVQALKVACIGNSITDMYHYTDSLHNRLTRGGYNDTVLNAGRTTCTMLKPAYSNCSYWDPNPTYGGKLASVITFRPAVVTIMLGTNDAKQGTGTVTGCGGSACYNNWKNKAQYAPAYYAMIDTIYLLLGYKPKIFCVFPPPAAPNNVICAAETSFTKEMIPMIQAVAANRGLATINCHQSSYQCNPAPADGIHPNKTGIDSLASWFYHGLTTIRMIPFPPSLAFTVSRGQTDTTGTTKLDTISNAAISGTLDSVQVTHKTTWLRNSVAGTPRNAQKISNAIVLASLPATAGTYYDTVTVSATAANPTSIQYIVTLTLQSGTSIENNSFAASSNFITDIRQVRAHEVRVALFSPGAYIISVITTAGRVVASRHVNGAGTYTMNIANGSPAMYIVKVQSSDGRNAAIRKIFGVIN